jgi:hypothetical protein
MLTSVRATHVKMAPRAQTEGIGTHARALLAGRELTVIKVMIKVKIIQTLSKVHTMKKKKRKKKEHFETKSDIR